MKSRSLFSVEYREYIDRFNEKSSCCEIYVKYVPNNEVERKKVENTVPKYLIYKTFSRDYAFALLEKCRIYEELLENVLLENEDVLPTMVIYNNSVYRIDMFCKNQCCVVLKMIEGNEKYGRLEESRKVDFLMENVRFCRKGSCLVWGNQLFMDGKLLMTTDKLMELCKKIGQDFSKLDWDNSKIIEWIKRHVIGATGYLSDTYSAYWGNKEENRKEKK